MHIPAVSVYILWTTEHPLAMLRRNHFCGPDVEQAAKSDNTVLPSCMASEGCHPSKGSLLLAGSPGKNKEKKILKDKTNAVY